MDKLKVVFANAFTREAFGGNPAAVMVLTSWLPDETLQALAEQHNLSETAFLVAVDEDTYELRWFTPAAEVELCGHATLASAHVLCTDFGFSGETIRFQTRFSGELRARVAGPGIELDFPAIPTVSHLPEKSLVTALGVPVIAAAIPPVRPWQAIYEVADEAILRRLQPDFAGIGAAVPHAAIVTAPGDDKDFVSRFFAPQWRVNEDPVTGSAHCLLTPYWAGKLDKQQLEAAQLSQRGGELTCRLRDDRVSLTGQCVTYARAELAV